MHANAFSFSAFQASFSSHRYHISSSDSPVGTPQDSGTVVGGTGSVDGGVVDGDEPVVIDSSVINTTGSDTIGSDTAGTNNGTDDAHQSLGQHASFASRVSFSFSSVSMGGLSGKVFEYEISNALQNRIGAVLDVSSSRIHSGRGGNSSQYQLPGGASIEPSQHHHRHGAHGLKSHGGSFGGSFGRSIGGPSQGFGAGLRSGFSEGLSDRHAGIMAAMDRIMSTISAHLARVVAEATGSESSSDTSIDSSVATEGDEISQAITDGVQSTQEALVQLGVEGESEAVAEAGDALLSEVAAQVADATAATTSTATTVTSTATTVTSTATTTAPAENFRYQFESAEESMRVKVKSLSHAGPVSSSFSSTTRGFDLMVETLDGDKVKVSFDQDFLKFKDRSADALVSGRYSSSDFQIRVEGDLDEGELEALNSLFESVSSLAQTFFQGNVEEAFNYAVSMGMDESELAGFSLNLYEQQVKSSIKAYDGVAALGARSVGESAEKGGVMDGQKAMRGLGDFVKHLKETLESQEAAKFKNVHQMIADLLSKQVDDMGRDSSHKNHANKTASDIMGIVAGAEKHHNDSTRSENTHKGSTHTDNAHKDNSRGIDDVLKRIMTGLSHPQPHRHAA
ncbi:MAG: hypothetical protein COB51_07325 [Moraxellaceae bacterium]|nr:MAG: hypothetical protein COB51_07325 [Moraxellaceae bacterium]